MSSLEISPRAQALFAFTLELGDDHLVLGHRLSEWCGHAPMIEEDIALANIALDCIGAAELFLSLAGEFEGAGRSADDLAYRRDVLDFRNALLVELPRGDFAFTVTRNFLFDAFQLLFLEELSRSKDERLAALAAKVRKEAAYHYRHSSAWVVRLGDGTAESHARMEQALQSLAPYAGELFEGSEYENDLIAGGFIPSKRSLKTRWEEEVSKVCREATLAFTEGNAVQRGGRRGLHTEHLDRLLSEMQFLPRAYPGAVW